MDFVSYLQPLLSEALFLLVIGAWSCRSAKTAKRSRVLALAIMGFFLLCWRPAAWMASRPLECWYVPRAFPEGEAQAIVVLSAAVRQPLPERPIPSPDNATYERCQYAACLHTHWRQLPVLSCGGVG